MPSTPRLTSPYLISWALRLWAILLGMAKPIPTLPPPGAKIAVLMPMSSPLRLIRAPPELPRLIAASVWIKFSKPSRFKPLRPNADTIPEVAVCPMPNGLPTATAKSPTRSLSESAIFIAVRFFASVSWISAISDCSSRPISLATYSRPSLSCTLIVVALLMTWLFVRT